MKNIGYVILTFLLMFSLACQPETEMDDQEDRLATGNTTPVTSRVVLNWEGEYEVDGCGFFLTIDDQRYKPADEAAINESFKQSTATGTEVVITYEILDTTIERYCGDLPQPTSTPGIHIFSIERTDE